MAGSGVEGVGNGMDFLMLERRKINGVCLRRRDAGATKGSGGTSSTLLHYTSVTARNQRNN